MQGGAWVDVVAALPSHRRDHKFDTSEARTFTARRRVSRCRRNGVGLPRFDGQGWWLGQATCLTTSWSVAVSNSSGEM
jgi:hypothetical protein